MIFLWKGAKLFEGVHSVRSGGKLRLQWPPILTTYIEPNPSGVWVVGFPPALWNSLHSEEFLLLTLFPTAFFFCGSIKRIENSKIKNLRRQFWRPTFSEGHQKLTEAARTL